MRTSQPFHSLKPSEFIPRRYSPVFATVVDDEVENVFKLCGLTFTEYFAALGCKLPEPVRVVSHTNVAQEQQEVFFGNVQNEVMMFSQSFIFPEYEESDTTNPQLAPFPGEFVDKFEYPSKESRNPPWFRTMVEMVVQSMFYADFDFCDVPACIVYASLSGWQTKTASEVKQMLRFPKWMQEFVDDIPIVHVVVYDGLLVSQKPSDASGSKGSFDALFGLCVRSRRNDSPGALDPAMLRELFKYDQPLLNNKNLGAYLGESDLAVARKLLVDIYGVARTKINGIINAHKAEIENSKQLGTRLKGFFNKKAPERVTVHMQIPWKKVSYLRLAGLHMIMHQYDEARKYYKMFNSSIKDGSLPYLRLFSMYMAAMASFIPNGSGAFQQQLMEVLQHIGQANNIRFFLLVPSLALEFHAEMGELVDAASLCRKAISKVSGKWSGNQFLKMIFMGLFYERLAGLLTEPRHSVLQTAKAELCYLEAKQTPHALRCLIWMYRVLPKDTWTLLSQHVWYEKARILLELKQWSRGLTNCKDLLALPNLDWSLHEKVISLFWTPYNDSGLPKDQLQVRVNSLLEVRGLTMLDKTSAEFWGFAPGEFKSVITEFDDWCRTEISKSQSVTFDSWYDDDETRRSRKQTRRVRVGGQVLLDIELSNRYKFSVHLDRAVLKADYQGDAPEGEKRYEIQEIHSKNIPGMTDKTTHLQFKFTPLVEGQFSVNTFEKNYWGYVDTQIECGPMVFNAVRDYPALSIELVNFPTSAYDGQCQKFEIVLKNIGDSLASGLAVVFDAPRSMVTLNKENTVKLNGLTIVKVPGALDVGESCRVPMVFVARSEGKSAYRFFAASHGIRCAFAKMEVDVTSAATFSDKFIAKMNDSACNAYHCTVNSNVDGLEIIGLMNTNHRLVKSMMIEPGHKLMKGETFSFMGLSSEETDTEFEEWRVSLMDASKMAILYRIDGLELPLQKNLHVNDRKTKYHIRVDMPVLVTVGSRCQCTFRLLSAKPGKVYYIEPSKFMHLDVAWPAARMPGVEVPSCCRWFGMTRATLTKENDYTATFLFKAFQCGVYEIQNITISEHPDFSSAVNIPMITQVQVEPISG